MKNKERIKTVSIVLPAFNEEKRLPPYLNSIIEYSKNNKLISEIIVVDDASTDKTPEIVANFAAQNPVVKILRNDINHGKGYSIRKGIANAKSDAVGYADADGATPIEEIEYLIKALNNGADIAIAYRTREKSKRSKLRAILAAIFYKIVNILVLPGIKDSQCGFKFFRKDAAEKIFPVCAEDRWSLDLEILYIARKKKMTIAEVPVKWIEQPGSKLNLMRDAVKMFFSIFRIKIRHSKVSQP